MKAVALLSGGLDSTLAAKLIKEQGIEVVALNFKTSFCQCDGKGAKRGCAAQAASLTLGLELKAININDDFLKLLKKPKHGFGSNMNPCIDCRILKFKKGKAFMEESGASFLITGEVLGQRPMSQHRRALMTIEKESGLEGLVLRPLSAQLLPETLPEKKGWVDRAKLLRISGRSRRAQMRLADESGIRDYPCPAGGCLLTDPEFAKRLKDFMSGRELCVNDVELLKSGRYFSLSEKAKLIVGRNEIENSRIESLAGPGDHLFITRNTAGPSGLGRGEFEAGLIGIARGIVERYCDHPADNAAIDITCRKI